MQRQENKTTSADKAVPEMSHEDKEMSDSHGSSFMIEKSENQKMIANIQMMVNELKGDREIW